MTFLELCNERRSVRAYEPRPVPRELLEKVLEAARLAPSAVNYQPWIFYVVTAPEMMAKLHEVYNREWFRTAPNAILACVDRAAAWTRVSDGKSHADIDGSIAVEHICLAATAEGLGTCWVCNFDIEATRKLFELPDNLEPLAILPIGYPDSDIAAAPKKRKRMEEIVRWL